MQQFLPAALATGGQGPLRKPAAVVRASCNCGHTARRHRYGTKARGRKAITPLPRVATGVRSSAGELPAYYTMGKTSKLKSAYTAKAWAYGARTWRVELASTSMLVADAHCVTTLPGGRPGWPQVDQARRKGGSWTTSVAPDLVPPGLPVSATGGEVVTSGPGSPPGWSLRTQVRPGSGSRGSDTPCDHPMLTKFRTFLCKGRRISQINVKETT